MRQLYSCSRKKKKLLCAERKNYVSYSLKFSSLFAPGLIKNLRLLMRSLPGANKFSHPERQSKCSKILVKQSYVLLVWFFYLTSISTGKDKSAVPGFFVYPKKVTKFTIIKAPMAHKTFSQEQFSFSSYSFGLTLCMDLRTSLACHKDAVVHFCAHFSSLNFFYGTNMLFLKSLKIFFLIKDRNFFSYYYFCNRLRLGSRS